MVPCVGLGFVTFVIGCWRGPPWRGRLVSERFRSAPKRRTPVRQAPDVSKPLRPAVPAAIIGGGTVGGSPPCSPKRRRQFITLLGGAAAWPLAAHAQQRGKVPRLGVLLFSNPQTDPQMEVLHSGLRDLGYDEQNLYIFYRYAEGKAERLTDLAAALLREKPDLVLALGGDVAPYAVKTTSTIPIVFVSSADPVQLGLAASLARPAGNATGVTLLLDDTASKRLEFLKEAVPRVRHPAFLWNPDHPDNELARNSTRGAKSQYATATRGDARFRRSR